MYGDRALTADQLTQVLTAMISGTPFSGAAISEIPYSKFFDPFQNMYVMMGNPSSGTAFNVWFARSAENMWQLQFNKVPSGGNLRSS